MKKRSLGPLQKLIRKEPSLEEFGALFARMWQPESYRECAIVLPAMVHSRIANLVLTKLSLIDRNTDAFKSIELYHPHREAVVEALFDRDGPLNSMSSTIILAYAMQLIDETTYENANTVRRIRNVFAHATSPVTFETPAIASECRGLRIEESDDDLTGHLRFFYACASVIRFCTTHGADLAIRDVNRIYRRLVAGLLKKVRTDAKTYGLSADETDELIRSLRERAAQRRTQRTRNPVNSPKQRKRPPRSSRA